MRAILGGDGEPGEGSGVRIPGWNVNNNKVGAGQTQRRGKMVAAWRRN